MRNIKSKMLINFKQLAFAFLGIALSSVNAANLPCSDWEEKLVAQVSKANSCDAKLKACIDKEFGNPMRELNYCQHVHKNCEALDTRPANAAWEQEITEFKKSCAKD